MGCKELIDGLGLKNFKAFQDEVYLPFKKMNIFLGPNSSGKSSFLKGLFLLNETIKSSEEEPALHLTEDIGDYKSIVYAKNTNKYLGFKLTFDKSEHFNESEQQAIMSQIRTKCLIALFKLKKVEQISLHELNPYILEKMKDYLQNPIAQIQISVKQTAKRPNVVHELILTYFDETVYTIEMERNSFYLKKGGKKFSQPNIVLPKKFLFKVDDEKFEMSHIDEVEDILKISITFAHIHNQMNQFFQQFLRIEPFRYRPSRTELVANFKYNTVGSDGKNILSAVIGLNQSQKENAMHTVKGNVNFWLKEFDLAQSVDAQELRNNHYSLIIKNKFTSIENNIMDVGVGTSQLLPIIMESFLAPKKSVLVIEEPETHIHPNAQAKLADLFATCIKNDNKRFFIETHSMYFVQKIQILVARGELNPQDVGIYYFNQSENGAEIQELTLASNGQFEQAFPKGFFDVAFELSKQFMDAIK